MNTSPLRPAIYLAIAAAGRFLSLGRFNAPCRLCRAYPA
jgi:hypothetical protein